MDENQNEQNNLNNTTQEPNSTNSTFCPSCGSKISENSSFCSHCGTKLSPDDNGGLKTIKETKKRSSGIVAWIIAVIAVIALLFTIAVSTVANRDNKGSDSLNSVEANATTSETTTVSEETTAPVTTTTAEKTAQTTTTTVETATEATTTTETTTKATTTTTLETTMASAEETSNEYINILAQYSYKNDFGLYTYHIMIVENISNVDIRLSTSTIAYSSNDSMLAVGNTSCDCLGSGCVTLLVEVLYTDEDVSYGETNWTISEPIYKSVTQDLSYVQNDINNGAIFQVTNNGNYTAEFVRGFTLFFLNGKLVDYNCTYFTDDDYEIKPGDTISKQITSYEDYDTIEFYLDGRHYGN